MTVLLRSSDCFKTMIFNGYFYFPAPALALAPSPGRDPNLYLVVMALNLYLRPPVLDLYLPTLAN